MRACGCNGIALGIESLIGAETVCDAAFLQIIRCHLYTDFVAGQDVDAVHAHTSGKVTVKFVILGLGTQDFDSERGIWEGFFHYADEFDNILRHKRKETGNDRKSRGILQSADGSGNRILLNM